MRLKKWFHRHSRTLSVAGILGLFAVLVVAVVVVVARRGPAEMPETVEAPTVLFRSRLNGAPVATAAEMAPNVMAVMIDNHPDARPPAGLMSAAIVYEALAEGGITRFLAVFPVTSTLPVIGPVRSARQYFIDWAAEYGPDTLYLHSGGSPEALTFLRTTKSVRDINEFFWGSYFYRSAERAAPHNLYLKTDSPERLAERLALAPAATWSAWHFDTDSGALTSASSTPAERVSFFVSPDEKIEWRFIAERNRYERFVNGRTHTVSGGSVIAAASVIVQEVDMRVVDEVGRREVATVGEGSARVLSHGNLARGTWRKKSRTARTEWFVEKTGEPLLLAPGSIWVEVVPTGTVVEVTR